MGQFRRQALVAAAFLASGFAILVARAQPSSPVSVELGARFGEFVVVNHGSAVLLNSTVSVEQKAGGRWEKALVSNLALREACAPSPPPKCTKLERTASLRPVPWTGSFCSSQCPSTCRLDGPAPAGTYRFVVTTCSGEHSYASPPFQKP